MLFQSLFIEKPNRAAQAATGFLVYWRETKLFEFKECK